MALELVENHWSRFWAKLELTVVVCLDITIIALVDLLGPGLAMTFLAGLAALLYSLYSQVGLTLMLILISHAGSLYGVTIPGIYYIKWGITLIFLAATFSRWLVGGLRIDYRPGKEEMMLLVLIGWGAVCSLFAVRPVDSVLEIIRYSLLLLVYVVSKATITEKRHLSVLLLAVIGVVLVNALVCLGEIGISGFVRQRGLLGNANYFGMFLMFCLPMLAMGIFAHKQKQLRLLFMLGLGIGIVLLLLSFSRAALLGCGVQLITFLILDKRKKLLGMLAATAILLVAIVALSPGLSKPAKMLLRVQSGTTHRTLLWEKGLDLLFENPLLGTGYGVQKGDISGGISWNDPVNYYLFAARDILFVPHNAFIYQFMTTGLIGGFLYLILFYLLLKVQFSSWRNAGTVEQGRLHKIMIAVIVGCIFHGFFESFNILTEAGVAIYFWVSLAIVNSAKDRNLLGQVDTSRA